MTVTNGDDPALPEPQAEADDAEMEAAITAIVHERGLLVTRKHTSGLDAAEAERLDFLTSEVRRLIPSVTPAMWEIVDRVGAELDAPNA